MNMRDFWANEAAAMRDTSAVLGAVNQDVKEPEKNNSDGVKGRYVFDNNGKFLRFEATGKPAVLQVGNTIYNFNDSLTDVGAIEYNITKPPKVFKLIRFIYILNTENIESMMVASGATNGTSRLYIAAESVAGKLDFSVYHLNRTILVQGGKGMVNYWEQEEILKDRGPIFLMPDSQTSYNLLDAGNWLWGYAMHRMGYDISDSLKYAKKYDKNDPSADQRAISSGWNSFKK
jgi:hypothetical protein